MHREIEPLAEETSTPVSPTGIYNAYMLGSSKLSCFATTMESHISPDPPLRIRPHRVARLSLPGCHLCAEKVELMAVPVARTVFTRRDAWIIA